MLLGNLTADGATGWVDVDNEDLRNTKLFAGTGTFGGGTLSLEISFNEDKSDPLVLSGSGLTASGTTNILSLAGVKWVRGSLTGSTTPNVNVYLGLG